MHRVLSRIDEIYAIGDGPGANRPALSLEEQQACELARGWMLETGLTVEWDPAGNLLGRRQGRSPELPEVWLGSHLDSVPQGGRFDGVLGVVGAIEAVQRLATDDLARTVAVVVFRDEESYRFGVHYYGSRAAVGSLQAEELERADAGGTTVTEALAALGFDAPPTGRWLHEQPHCFLELHVEQGPVLAEAVCPLGLVGAIVGMAPLTVTFTGEAGHAGTTPMRGRRDALVAAARFVERVREAGLAAADSTATVGRLDCAPNASNVIAERVRVDVDLRSTRERALEDLVARVRSHADWAAATEGCEVSVDQQAATGPVTMSGPPVEALERALDDAGVRHVTLPSGAGHDSAVLATNGVPTAMLFARSLAGGASHNPAEDTDPEAVELAVEVLAGAVRRLAA
jgi:allantoate deiminase